MKRDLRKKREDLIRDITTRYYSKRLAIYLLSLKLFFIQYNTMQYKKIKWNTIQYNTTFNFQSVYFNIESVLISETGFLGRFFILDVLKLRHEEVGGR